MMRQDDEPVGGRRAIRSRNEQTPVAICGNPRTGTGSLYEFLRDLGVDVVHEPLHPRKREARIEAFAVEHELQRIYREHHGMKHLWPHICEADNHALCKWLVRKSIPVLHLERRNRVRQALSMKLATTTGLWGVERSDQRGEYARRLRSVTLAPTELTNMAERLERTERSYKNTLSAGLFMVVHYEDLYTVCGSRREKTVCGILRFLGLKIGDADLSMAARRLHPSRKQTTTDLVRSLPNAEELEAVLGNTGGE